MWRTCRRCRSSVSRNTFEKYDNACRCNSAVTTTVADEREKSKAGSAALSLEDRSYLRVFAVATFDFTARIRGSCRVAPIESPAYRRVSPRCSAKEGKKSELEIIRAHQYGEKKIGRRATTGGREKERKLEDIVLVVVRIRRGRP